MTFRIAIVIAVAAIACSSRSRTSIESTATPPANAVITDGAEIASAVGKQITVRGTARDAKLSAAVMIGSEVVYCLDLDHWPDAVSGAQITAHGTLDHSRDFVASTGPDGAISQGTDGAVYVLRDCEYDAR